MGAVARTDYTLAAAVVRMDLVEVGNPVGAVARRMVEVLVVVLLLEGAVLLVGLAESVGR